MLAQLPLHVRRKIVILLTKQPFHLAKAHYNRWVKSLNNPLTSTRR